MMPPRGTLGDAPVNNNRRAQTESFGMARGRKSRSKRGTEAQQWHLRRFKTIGRQNRRTILSFEKSLQAPNRENRVNGGSGGDPLAINNFERIRKGKARNKNIYQIILNKNIEIRQDKNHLGRYNKPFTIATFNSRSMKRHIK